jgi:hypothetical protein
MDKTKIIFHPTFSKDFWIDAHTLKEVAMFASLLHANEYYLRIINQLLIATPTTTFLSQKHEQPGTYCLVKL